MEELQTAPLLPTAKPRVRVRTHLTSIQLDKTQKQLIDRAYQIYTAESPVFISKGQFLVDIAEDYLRRRNPSMEG